MGFVYGFGAFRGWRFWARVGKRVVFAACGVQVGFRGAWRGPNFEHASFLLGFRV